MSKTEDRINQLNADAEAQGLEHIKIERTLDNKNWKVMYWIKGQPCMTAPGIAETIEEAIIKTVEQFLKFRPVPKSTNDMLNELGL